MKKIIIWGIGDICREFQRCVSGGTIIAYIDNRRQEKTWEGKRVYTWDEFVNCNPDYDYIVIASVYTNEIFEQCIHSVDAKKLIFLRPLEQTDQVEMYQRNIRYLQEIAPDYTAEALRESGKRMGIDRIEKPVCDCYPLYYYDYFRYRTFELIAGQIENLSGDIAEVGVYRGYFASIINRKFPRDTFYLFDTFEGFEESEAQRELQAGNCDENFIEIFKKTSVEQVKSKLTFQENCVIRKGFFPKTAEDLDTEFKFVSIDVDFEDSIYEALVYFYPRLVKGGFLFIHDYNEPTLKGVRRAVERYETAYGTMIKIPIADKCGTLIVTK